MRLVWTLPCRYTAAMVSTALFTAAITDAAFYTAIRVDAVSFFLVVGGCCPLLLLLVRTLTLYTAVSVYAAYLLRIGWVLSLLMLWALTLPLYAANWRRCCNLYCCSRGTRPFILLFVGTQIFLLLIVGAPQQCFCLHSSLTRRPPSRPRHRSSPPAALSQVVSSGDETGYSGRLRSSARPRQDDQDTERVRSRSRTSEPSEMGELQGRRI